MALPAGPFADYLEIPMPDIIYTVLNGVNKTLRDLGDGTYAEVIALESGSIGSGGGSSADLDTRLRATPLPTKDANGAGAVRYTTDTTAVTGSFAQIMCLTATTFSLLTRTGATGSLAGIALPAGTLLIGPFTAYTLASGAVAAYA
jgi:hypothetical protein